MLFRSLREAGFRPPEPECLVQDWPLCPLVPLSLTLLIIPALLQSQVAAVIVTCLIVLAGVLAFKVRRTRVVHVPLGPRTVGELVIYLTRFSDHEGYRFSRNEIGLKVRFVIAEWLGVPVDRVREDSTFVDLESW